MKQFETLSQWEEFINEATYNRFSPYEIISVDRENLTVLCIRVD